MKSHYYLSRLSPTSRYALSRTGMKGAENIGPIEGYQEAKTMQAELNAAIPPRAKKPGGGRKAKPHRLHNLKIREDLSARLVAEAGNTGQTVTGVVERLIETNL